MLIIVDHLDGLYAVGVLIELRRQRHHGPRRPVRHDSDLPVIEPLDEFLVQQRHLHHIVVGHARRREEISDLLLQLLHLDERPVRRRVDCADHTNEVRWRGRQVLRVKAGHKLAQNHRGIAPKARPDGARHGVQQDDTTCVRRIGCDITHPHM